MIACNEGNSSIKWLTKCEIVVDCNISDMKDCNVLIHIPCDRMVSVFNRNFMYARAYIEIVHNSTCGKSESASCTSASELSVLVSPTGTMCFIHIAWSSVCNRIPWHPFFSQSGMHAATHPIRSHNFCHPFTNPRRAAHICKDFSFYLRCSMQAKLNVAIVLFVIKMETESSIGMLAAQQIV
mgnify:CR=1 FL=1